MADLSKITVRVVKTECEKGIHAAFDRREHDTDGLECWCKPTYLLPCECDNGCWKCTDGSTELTPEEARATDEPLVIVHNGMELLGG